MSTTKPVPIRGPADAPLAMGRPAADSPARGTVRRMPVVRFHSRMVRGRLYPLSVQLRDEHAGSGGLPGDGFHGGTVTVQPVIPGALVTPQSVELSTAPGSEACFWVTALALGRLRDARIEFRSGHRLLSSMPLRRSPDWLVMIASAIALPLLAMFAAVIKDIVFQQAIDPAALAWCAVLLPVGPLVYLGYYSRFIKVRRGWWPWVLLLCAFILPALLFMAKRDHWEYSVKLPDDLPRPEGLREQLGGRRNAPARPRNGGQPPAAEPGPAASSNDKKPEEPKKDSDKPAEKKDGGENREPEQLRPDDAPVDSFQAADQDLALAPEEQEPDPAKAPPEKTPPEKAPATKTDPGEGRGGAGAQRPGAGRGGRPPGGPGGPRDLHITYHGTDAIEAKFRYVERTPLDVLETEDLPWAGLAVAPQTKDALLDGYSFYDFMRHLPHSEAYLLVALLTLALGYWALFGPARVKCVGRPVDLPAT